MDKETWVAFKIAVAIAVVVGFGLWQFNLKWSSERDYVDRVTDRARTRIPITSSDSIMYFGFAPDSITHYGVMDSSVVGDTLYVWDILYEPTRDLGANR